MIFWYLILEWNDGKLKQFVLAFNLVLPCCSQTHILNCIDKNVPQATDLSNTDFETYEKLTFSEKNPLKISCKNLPLAKIFQDWMISVKNTFLTTWHYFLLKFIKVFFEVWLPPFLWKNMKTLTWSSLTGIAIISYIHSWSVVIYKVVTSVTFQNFCVKLRSKHLLERCKSELLLEF